MNPGSRAHKLLATTLSVAILVGYSAAPVLGGGSGPSEDYVVADADGTVPISSTGTLLMGSLCLGQEYNFTVLVAAQRKHFAPTGGWDDSAVLTFSAPNFFGPGLSGTWPTSPNNQITLPSNWKTSIDGTKSDYITSVMTFVPESTGAYLAGIGFEASGKTATGSGTFVNGGSLNVSAFVYDCPSITVTTPADGATYVAGTNVLADYECTVNSSAIAYCNAEGDTGYVPDGDPIDTSTVGMKTFTVSSSTEAGGTASKTVHYRVVYPFEFIAPTNEVPGASRDVTAGPMYQVRFSLDGYHGSNVLQGWPRHHRVNCDTGKALSALSTSGIKRVRYFAGIDTYVVTWDTKESWVGQCRTFVVRLRDGTRHTAKFTFTGP